MGQTADLVEAIKARLQQKMPDVRVENYPDRPAEYRLNHPGGALLVGFRGTEPGNGDDRGGPQQGRRVRITVTVVTVSHRGPNGAMDRLDECRAALLAWSPKGPLWPALEFGGESFLTENGAAWVFEQDWLAHDVVRAAN
jgi:hypothetical protein